MFELFENLTNWLWGLPLLITILATGVYLTVRSGFFQFRHFGYIVKNMFSKERRQEGGDDGKSLTPFQAISIAIGGTVGIQYVRCCNGYCNRRTWGIILALDRSASCHGHQDGRGNTCCILQRETAKR